MSGAWALFLSGRGSTAQSLLDLSGELDIRVVVSSRRKAPGVLRARRSGIPVVFFGKDSSWDQLTKDLRRFGVSRIFLVGFMRLLPAEFVGAWRGKIWNVHPSLLPAYPGADAMKRNFAEKTEMGVSVHEVTAEMDAGPLKMQTSIERSPDWDETQLRMSRTEQRLLRQWALRASLGRCA